MMTNLSGLPWQVCCDRWEWRSLRSPAPRSSCASPRLADAACAIADVQMPGMGGLELQERLIALGHRLPIIFVTAYPDERVRARALAAGAVCFLGKPFAAQDLTNCIDAALRGAVQP